MATVQELQARIDAAIARTAEAAAKGDVDAELRAMEDEDAARAEMIAEVAKPRKLAGKRMERAAKAKAAGSYQVGAFDIAGALPQIDPAKLPPGGVVIFRSPAPDVRKRAEAAVKAAADDPVREAEATVTFVMECTVAPEEVLTGLGADAYRRFWETVGTSMVNLASTQVQNLGGFQLEAFKRATK